MNQDCLPKKFCCCIRLKHAVIGICAYLILISIVQIIALTGLYDLGYNNILTIGDIFCGIFALLSLFSIKKLKVGTPLKILAFIWIICIALNGVAWQEHVKRQNELKQKLMDHLELKNVTLTTLSSIPQQSAQSNIQLQNPLTSSVQLQDQSQEQQTSDKNAQKTREVYDTLVKSVQDLDEKSISIVFVCWTILKVYCSLCVLKLGKKMDRKHGKNFYYKLV